MPFPIYQTKLFLVYKLIRLRKKIGENQIHELFKKVVHTLQLKKDPNLIVYNVLTWTKRVHNMLGSVASAFIEYLYFSLYVFLSKK